jgi:ring-1,2-phenylacetyl-CoA epoxidase subunit PaaE
VATTSHFHPLRIRSVRPDTDEAVIVSFDVPEDLAPAFRFIHGQHLTLRNTIGGSDERRSYSICAGTFDGELREIGRAHV